jgi:hypothetical protein
VSAQTNPSVRVDTHCVRTDKVHPRGHSPVSARTRAASARKHSFPSSPSRKLPSSRPCRRSLLSARTSCVRTDADADVQNKKNKNFKFKKKSFFGSCCRLKKKKKKIRFSIPKIPKLPKLPGLRRRSYKRRRFFRPSSPSHPSKFYSSLRLLNSKVPKPFSPFSLRLIDVDGF